MKNDKYELAENTKRYEKMLFNLCDKCNLKDETDVTETLKTLVMFCLFNNEMMQLVEDKLKAIISSKDFEAFADEFSKKGTKIYFDLLNRRNDGSAKMLVLDTETHEFELLDANGTTTGNWDEF